MISSTTGGWALPSTLTQLSAISKLVNHSGNLFTKELKKKENKGHITKGVAAYDLSVHQTIHDNANYVA